MQPNYGGYPNPAHIDPRYAAQYGPQFQQPQYAPQPQQVQQYGQPVPTPQQAVAANLPAGDFADPRAGSGEVQPRIRHLLGRTVIIEPIRIDENAKGLPQKDGTVPINPCAYANVTVVDGGPITYGNELNGSRETKPNDRQVAAPYRILNMMIGNTWIVNAIRDALPPLGNGLLLGVLEEGTQGNRPFLLTKCETTVTGQDRPDGAQRREAARQLWAQIKAAAFTNAAPVLLQPVAGSAYATQPGYPAAVHMPPTDQQWVNQQMATAGAPAPYPYAQAQQQYATAPMVPVGLPPGFDVTQVPPGWDAGAWAGFAANPAQAAAIWTNILANAPQGPLAPQGQVGAGPGW